MNLVPKEILMSHLQRSEGAEEVSLPIDFFRDLLYQAMPRTWVGLTDEDEIIEMAKSINEDWWLDDIDLKAFAKLVAEREREACAKYVEEYETDNDITATWLNIIADAIRAREQP